MSDLSETNRYNWSVLYVDSKNGDFWGTRQPLKLEVEGACIGQFSRCY